MRRGVGVYEQLVRRFTAQTTDYQQLLSTFAEGLYTEMDFRNEALNAVRMREVLSEAEGFRRDKLVIPQPIMELTTRRVLTMEWVTGVKLTSLPAEEVKRLVGVGQEAFLVQLLEVGFFHGDPHPGNLLKVTEGPDAGKLALLDFGLVAEIPARDRAAMVSATIHLANRNWSAMVDDFIALDFLPQDANRAVIIPVMERVLGPYLRGGGAKAFNFQALSQDLLTTTLEIPFSVPPYMSLLARSVATLEGIALTADPNYQMVAQAYPFVARKVLRDDSSGTAALLRDLVYDGQGRVRPGRLSALLQAALGHVSEQLEGFVDFDAVPQEGASAGEILQFVLSPEARELRPLLVNWLAGAADLVLRDRARKAAAALPGLLTPRLPFAALLRLPQLPSPPPPPVLIPGRGMMSLNDAVALLAPPLTDQEVIYYQSLVELAGGILGVPAAQLESPGLDTITNLILQPAEQVRELQTVLASLGNGDAPTSAATQEVAVGVVNQIAAVLADRAGVDINTLFPLRRMMLQGLERVSSSTVNVSGDAASSSSSKGIAYSSSSRNGSRTVGNSSESSSVYQANVPADVASNHAVLGSNGAISSIRGSSNGVLQPSSLATAVLDNSSSESSTLSNGRTLIMRQL
eukprot:GHRR01007579.1.p1 GENE.GHRR01007579.1~~GHRR01007579.1.p1  ORF type:complete len:633 (+),score=243.40 GHRR01007579.1:333-2231(+)